MDVLERFESGDEFLFDPAVVCRHRQPPRWNGRRCLNHAFSGGFSSRFLGRLAGKPLGRQAGRGGDAGQIPSIVL
jgi:hypothetical protein